MASINKDIKENALYSFSPRVLKILLKDKTTRKNIVWATDDYASYGQGFQAQDEIQPSDIEGLTSIIKPRVEKSKEEQQKRIRGKAEVFTPSWICNKQNNLVDNAWFGRDNVFNIETENGWETIYDKVEFPDSLGKTWQDYVKAKRLEITCGEAPYLTSRYDAITGSIIPVKDRIGLLDRKLRIVSENVNDEQEWYKWAKIAVQNSYGYDWQGDNVLLARENLLYAFAEAYEDKFEVPAIPEYLIDIAKVLSWNIWQMDGIKYVVPNTCHDIVESKLTIFGEELTTSKCPGCTKGDHGQHNGIYARTYDWVDNHSIEFYSIVKGISRKGEASK